MAGFRGKFFKGLASLFKGHCLAFIAGMVVAVLCFVAINAAMVPLSSSEYCGTKCHEMNSCYERWKLSPHYINRSGIRVECIDCHLPGKDKYFAHLTAKGIYGVKDLYKHYFGGEYNTVKMSKKVIDGMSNDLCLRCHNDLLSDPSGPAARIAHMASLKKPELAENHCLECHEDAGHQAESEPLEP